MRESFSTSEQFLKKQARQEIEEGIAEYLASPRSKNGMRTELAETFELERSEQPLSREEVEKEIEGFVGRNLEVLLPLFLSQEQDNDKLIKIFGLMNKEIGLFGANYYIREKDGKSAIFITNEYYPEGTLDDVSPSDLFALAYAKENIRVDSKRETGIYGGMTPHRYYLKSKKRYLCVNDFGMRVWNEEEEKMDQGDITNVTPFIQTVKQQIDRMVENLQVVSNLDYEKIQKELQEAAKQTAGVQYLDDEQQQVVDRRLQEQLVQNLARRFAENKKDMDLVLGAVPARKVRDHLHFNFDKIAKKYGFVGNDPEKDYQSFDQNSPRLNKLLREPTEQERAGVSFDFFYSDFYQKPVIVAGHLDKDSVISEACSGVKEVLARRAVENDPKTKELFDRARCNRGGGSPYFYQIGRAHV